MGVVSWQGCQQADDDMKGKTLEDMSGRVRPGPSGDKPRCFEQEKFNVKNY